MSEIVPIKTFTFNYIEGETPEFIRKMSGAELPENRVIPVSGDFDDYVHLYSFPRFQYSNAEAWLGLLSDKRPRCNAMSTSLPVTVPKKEEDYTPINVSGMTPESRYETASSWNSARTISNSSEILEDLSPGREWDSDVNFLPEPKRINTDSKLKRFFKWVTRNN